VKKAWKWALVVLGIPALCVAILWIDSYYRAVAAIRAEDARLEKDIAAFRARLKFDLPIGAAYLRGKVSPPWSFHDHPDPFNPADGHTGQWPTLLRLAADRDGLTTYPGRPPVPEEVRPGDAEMSSLVLILRTVRHCGFNARELGYQFEIRTLLQLESVLSKGLPASELRRVADFLDRAMASRSTFADSVEAEYLMDRAEVLRVLHLKADPNGRILRAPGWRDFFSWRIFLVKCIRQLDDDFALLRANDPYVVRFEKRSDLTRSFLRESSREQSWNDRNALGWWTVARVGVAVSLFRAERGRNPAKLDELVPDYLPRIPLSPVHGDALRLNDGVVIATVGPEFAITWPLRD
jgi:hypothetical protein